MELSSRAGIGHWHIGSSRPGTIRALIDGHLGHLSIERGSEAGGSQIKLRGDRPLSSDNVQYCQGVVHEA
jgi:hypothetical protein